MGREEAGENAYCGEAEAGYVGACEVAVPGQNKRRERWKRRTARKGPEQCYCPAPATRTTRQVANESGRGRFHGWGGCRGHARVLGRHQTHLILLVLLLSLRLLPALLLLALLLLVLARSGHSSLLLQPSLLVLRSARRLLFLLPLDHLLPLGCLGPELRVGVVVPATPRR